MAERLSPVQMDALAVGGAEMTGRERGVDEDHPSHGRRRGVASRSGAAPPNRARRRALSRWMSARRASRTIADFSVRPVKAWALARSSSSRVSVVRMGSLSVIRLPDSHFLGLLSKPFSHGRPLRKGGLGDGEARRDERGGCRTGIVEVFE